MTVNTTDEIFIGAPPDEVYRALLTFGKDSSWWPGARTSADGTRLSMRLPAGRVGSVRVEARVDNVRPDEGLTWWMEAGDVTGRGEWWLERFKDGTIVHYYLEAEGERIARRVMKHRVAVRRGMNALKDELERG